MKFLAIIGTIFLMFSAFSNEVPKMTIAERLQVQQAASLGNLENLLNKKNNIIGIELVIADAGENAESQWGHALLHFVDADKDSFNDVVLGFVAEVDDEQLSTRKGITGGYKVIPELKTIGEYWNQYVALEERGLNRYIIPTSVLTREELINVVADYFRNRDQLGNYYFLNNNCATVMFNFLSKVDTLKRYQLSVSANTHTNHGKRIDQITLIDAPSIPNNLPSYFARNALTQLPALRVLHSGPMHKKLIKLLNVNSYKDLMLGNWPSDNQKSLNIIEDNFTNKEIIRLLIEVVRMPINVRKSLIKKHSFRNSNVTREEIIGITLLPGFLYQTINEKFPLDESSADLTKWWSKEELSSTTEEIKTSIKKLKANKEFIRYRKLDLKISQEYINHYQFIYQYLEAL
jgi:hypothetical protein